MSQEKVWKELAGDAKPFWGLGYDFDPQWVLTDSQKQL